MKAIKDINEAFYQLDVHLDNKYPVEDQKHYSKAFWSCVDNVRIKNLELIDAFSKLTNFR